VASVSTAAAAAAVVVVVVGKFVHGSR